MLLQSFFEAIKILILDTIRILSLTIESAKVPKIEKRKFGDALMALVQVQIANVVSQGLASPTTTI